MKNGQHNIVIKQAMLDAKKYIENHICNVDGNNGMLEDIASMFGELWQADSDAQLREFFRKAYLVEEADVKSRSWYSDQSSLGKWVMLKYSNYMSMKNLKFQAHKRTMSMGFDADVLIADQIMEEGLFELLQSTTVYLRSTKKDRESSERKMYTQFQIWISERRAINEAVVFLREKMSKPISVEDSKCLTNIFVRANQSKPIFPGEVRGHVVCGLLSHIIAPPFTIPVDREREYAEVDMYYNFILNDIWNQKCEYATMEDILKIMTNPKLELELGNKYPHRIIPYAIHSIEGRILDIAIQMQKESSKFSGSDYAFSCNVLNRIMSLTQFKARITATVKTPVKKYENSTIKFYASNEDPGTLWTRHIGSLEDTTQWTKSTNEDTELLEDYNIQTHVTTPQCDYDGIVYNWLKGIIQASDNDRYGCYTLTYLIHRITCLVKSDFEILTPIGYHSHVVDQFIGIMSDRITRRSSNSSIQHIAHTLAFIIYQRSVSIDMVNSDFSADMSAYDKWLIYVADNADAVYTDVEANDDMKMFYNWIFDMLYGKQPIKNIDDITTRLTNMDFIYGSIPYVYNNKSMEKILNRVNPNVGIFPDEVAVFDTNPHQNSDVIYRLAQQMRDEYKNHLYLYDRLPRCPFTKKTRASLLRLTEYTTDQYYITPEVAPQKTVDTSEVNMDAEIYALHAFLVKNIVEKNLHLQRREYIADALKNPSLNIQWYAANHAYTFQIMPTNKLFADLVQIAIKMQAEMSAVGFKGFTKNIIDDIQKLKPYQ